MTTDATTATETRPSRRRLFREAVREAKNGRASISVPDLAREVQQRLETQYPGFTEELAGELTRMIVYEETLREVGESRSASLFDIDRVAQSAARRSIGERLLRWEEWTGERHFTLAQMTRPLLRSASGIRRKRADRELRVAAWQERLAGGLPDDTTTVGNHFQADQIESLYREVVLRDDDDLLDPALPAV